MKYQILTLMIFTLSSISSFAEATKKRTVSSVKEVNFETFSMVYDESGEPKITFKSLDGKVLGVYKSQFKLFMNDSAVAKVEGREFLVTTWLNGNATYNVRVFLPNANAKWFKGKSFVNAPICDLGLQGDVPDLTTSDRKIYYNTVNGKPNFSVLVNNFIGLKYQSCP